jgi:hypothetical protein
MLSDIQLCSSLKRRMHSHTISIVCTVWARVIFDHNNVCHTKVSIELTCFPLYDAFLTTGRNYGADGAYVGSSPGAPVLLNWLLGGGGYVEYIQPLVNRDEIPNIDLCFACIEIHAARRARCARRDTYARCTQHPIDTTLESLIRRRAVRNYYTLALLLANAHVCFFVFLVVCLFLSSDDIYSLISLIFPDVNKLTHLQVHGRRC